jgi:hypothetical protein
MSAWGLEGDVMGDLHQVQVGPIQLISKEPRQGSWHQNGI